ncbi:MAG: hypothetical protein DRN66_00695 [Candidatus Nanohalarchaeota archaeon]|nr:MAG: hypothetical protein DRN66_00695 [Candidatus Nanohaloarchaeota archaeon]
MEIYGPVPSWRLGNSLGVDLVEPPKGYSKICSYDCLYCQLGHNTFRTIHPKTMDVSEQEFDVLREKIKQTKPDYITFSGQGEPTLNLSLGRVADKIKQMTDIPLAVLTNGSLISNKEVRRSLNKCDLVIAKTDAGTQRLFRKINQPCRGINLNNIVEGIKEIHVRVAIQTLLFSFKKLTNVDEESIKSLIEIYKKINEVKPIEIFLGTAYRPSGSEKIMALTPERLEEIAGQINRETKIQVVYYKKNEPVVVRGERHKTEEKEFLDLLKRRPCTKEDLITRFGKGNLRKIIDDFVEKGQVSTRIKQGVVYYFYNNEEEKA